jgi:CBS domain containing-hemolysin-like protein
MPGDVGSSPWLWGWLALAAVAATVTLFALAALVERSGPVRLRHWAEEAGGRLLALYQSLARFNVFRLVLSFAAKLAPLWLLWALAETLGGLGVANPSGWALPGVIAVVAAAELLNRVLVDRDAERALRALTVLYRGVHLLLLPLVAVLAPLVPARRVDDEEDGDEEDDASDEEIEAFIDFGTREGILEPEEGEMVWGIVDFGETQVRSVMTPRIDMICAPVETDLDALADLFLDSGHARLPLYEESIDHIVGVLHIRDLLRALRSEPRPVARQLAKPPLFVNETRPLDELLKEMQARFQQMAIVLDEYGGTAGMVTVEDLIEEIVGEIADEPEIAEPEPERLDDGRWRLDGRTHVSTLDELFDLDLEEEPYETVAGLILSALGQVPEPGETVETHGLKLTVEQVAGRRIQAVVVEGPAAPAEEASDG